MDNEWGPWIEHDGKGCPVAVGIMIQFYCRFYDGSEKCHTGRMTAGFASSIVWGKTLAFDVIRYRIRKPRGLTILQSLIEDLPTPAREPENV